MVISEVAITMYMYMCGILMSIHDPVFHNIHKRGKPFITSSYHIILSNIWQQ